MPVAPRSPHLETQPLLRGEERGSAVAERVWPEGFYERDEWKLACRVAASKGMSKSDLLPRFLLHICELALCGRAEEITEQRIGTVVFKRPADYNPGEDNIVRSYARTMRKRLDEYFAGEGRGELLRIDIPRGGYTPVFRAATAGESHPAGELKLEPGRVSSGERLVYEEPAVQLLERAPMVALLEPASPAEAGLVAGLGDACRGRCVWGAGHAGCDALGCKEQRGNERGPCGLEPDLRSCAEYADCAGRQRAGDP